MKLNSQLHVRFLLMRVSVSGKEVSSIILTDFKEISPGINKIKNLCLRVIYGYTRIIRNKNFLTSCVSVILVTLSLIRGRATRNNPVMAAFEILAAGSSYS